MVPLSTEATYVLKTQWTDATEWHDMQLKPAILKMVAQLSSRIFLGDKICRDPEWLDITINYTINAFTAAQELRLLPEFMRPFAVRYLPTSRKAQRQLKQARRIIDPVLEERRAANRSGRGVEYHDAIQWLEDTSKGRNYDPAAAQLALSAAAIHTTTDLFTQTVLDICGREDLIRELREEIVTVVQAEGWKKTTLYKLKLMDSVIKECQRLKPMAIGEFNICPSMALDRVYFNDEPSDHGTRRPRRCPSS
jgi:cytochrome P450